jgi:hypothetical protein
MRVPGPAALNAPPQMPMQGAPSPGGGVAGVSMAPVTQIAPPAGPGGPHQLPQLPQVPLPQGFPNPFSFQQMQQAPPQPAPQAPGVVQVTGPAGYLPGLGYFGSPAAPGQPYLPGPAAGTPAPPVQAAVDALLAAPSYQGQPGPASPPPPTAFPVLPGSMQAGPLPPPVTQPVTPPAPQYAPQFAPQVAPQAAPPPNPFWLQLAWQLMQTPAVRTALGDRYEQLTEGEERLRFLQTAAACLAGQELQGAFKALTTGGLDQTRFTTLFADHLVRALG